MRNKTILIADDDAAILDSLQIMLEMADYEVSTTIDGKVFAMIKQKKPDLLLLDIWMSGADGRKICKKMKSIEETRDIPIIMISASRDVKKSTIESGADDFLEKPFNMENLLTKIKTLI